MESEETFKCDIQNCLCKDYISKEGKHNYAEEIKSGKLKEWPRCQCGHIAEEHN